jgi:Alpha/beta hydrolase family
MDHVHSRDGTRIAYERLGQGPAVILVGGGLDDGSENAPLAAELAAWFTVCNYARRGRAGSGDTPLYALERELEDLEALIAELGGTAHFAGVSSGGALALEAAAAGLPVGRIAVYEVPYPVGEEATRAWREYVEQLEALLADDRRADALRLFMALAGSSPEGIAEAERSPWWPGLKALAHTLAYDAACLRDGAPPTGVAQPTLVLTGGAAEFFERAADALAASLPRAQRRTLDGQGHVADPKVLAAALAEFFA